jgi:hypothetical protein
MIIAHRTHCNLRDGAFLAALNVSSLEKTTRQMFVSPLLTAYRLTPYSLSLTLDQTAVLVTQTHNSQESPPSPPRQASLVERNATLARPHLECVC